MLELPVVLLYIDPGIGFLTLQILAGTLPIVAFYLHKTKSQIRSYIRIIFRRKDGEESRDPGS